MSDITIHLGWWMIPALVTLGSLAYVARPGEPDYSYYGADFAGALVLLVAIIGNLIVWLIWAVLT